MQPTFDALGIELLKHGYRRVVFIEVECKIDGTYRLGVCSEQPIGDHFECPECHEQRPCSGILATGYSCRLLPFEEFWFGPGNWDQMSAREYLVRKPKLAMNGRARHYRKTLQVDAREPEESCSVA
jgi:hypothetical protein